MKVRAGVTTILRRPPRRSKPKEKDSLIEMAEEVLCGQTRARARRTGQSHASARAAVIQTPAGWQLEQLRSGLHKDEEARYWQANMLFERVSAQAGHPV
jgi:hypothetical protein